MTFRSLGLPHSLPYGSATVAVAADAWPQQHPAQAAMRAMGSGPRPIFTAAELAARCDRELAFWAGLSGAAPVQDRIRRRYAEKIAVAERREARAARIERIETALDQAEIALARSCDVVTSKEKTIDPSAQIPVQGLIY